jgi:hypothetical protein
LLPLAILKSLPNFGHYLKEKKELIAQQKEIMDILDVQAPPSRPVLVPQKPIPTVKVR